MFTAKINCVLPALCVSAQLVTSVAATGCGENVQPEYNIRLLAVPGQTPLANATTVTLEAVGTGVQSTVNVKPGVAPALTLTKLDPRKAKAATFVVKVNGPQGLLAYGQTPRIRLVQGIGQFLILVQQPGTLALASDPPLIGPLTGGAVVTALAAEPEDPNPITVPVFLGGRTLDTKDTEIETTDIGIYNPYFHAMARPGFFTPAGEGAAVWARNNGTLWFFGGRTIATEGKPAVYGGVGSELGTSQLLTSIGLGLVASYGSNETAGVPRAFTVMTEVDGLIFAFGGEGRDPGTGIPGPLASVVQINPKGIGDAVVRPAMVIMAAPRIGHTATAISVASPTPHTDVLIFGGSVAPAPVAELLSAGMFTSLEQDTGPMRSGHSVVRLPDNRYLIVGGVGDDGVPVADARIYDPQTRGFSVAPLSLQTPRAGASIFAVGNDLVIAGGLNAEKNPVGSAERFDLTTLQPLPVLPATARTEAQVAYVPDGTVLLVGGRAVDPKKDSRLRPTPLMEVYRPRDLPAL